MHVIDVLMAGRPLPFVWPYWVPFWAIWAWAFWPEFVIVRAAQRRAPRAESHDAGSIRVILVGMQVAWLLALPLAWVRALQLPAAFDRPVFALGVAVWVSGSLLRRHCWRVLGSSFTGEVQARADQQIIASGAYARLRHPSYTGGLLMWVGIGLTLGSWGSTLLLLIASLLTYAYRISVEERALLAVVGEPYRAFCASRKRLIPFIY